MKEINRNKRLNLLVLPCLIFYFAIVGAIIPAGFELVVEERDNGHIYLAVPLEPGEFFTLHYIHSVSGCPVWEKHSIDSTGTIHINEEKFAALGAGMGHWPGHGIHTHEGKYQIIQGIDRPIGNFSVRVSAEKYEQSIILRGTAFSLPALAYGKVLTISAVPVSAIKRLWRILVPCQPSPKAEQEA